MKIKQLIKKAFTMVELVIVIAAVAVLAATSVGIYFGVMNNKPDEQSLSVQEQVISLWEGYISDSTKYYDEIEKKAFEFCTEYASKKGINVDLNYRVLEYDDFVSTIVEANGGIQKAYDPSGNAKEAVIIKIETTYPSYFVSTAYSVLKVNQPKPTEEMLIKDIVNDPFVIESGLLTRYRINENSTKDSFNNFYELSPINVNGEIKRGIRYVRYLINHSDNNSEEVYKPEYIVFGRANRTLNEECKGEYLPNYFEVQIGDMTLNTTTYDLIESRNNISYLYDPDNYYHYFESSFTHNEALTSVEVYDRDSEKFVTKESPLSTFDAQYVVGEQKISYDPYVSLGGDKDDTSKPDGEIDINTPLEDLPERPSDEDLSTEDLVKVFPIILYFSESIEVTIEGMPTMSKLLNALGFRDKKFQFLYFNNFESLSILIESPNFYELTTGLTDKNVYIYVCDGAVLDIALTLRDIDANSGFNFVVYHRPEIEVKDGVAKDIRLDNLYDITGKREGFKREEPELTLDAMYMNQKNYSTTNGTPYKVTWPEKPTKTFTIARTGVLTVGTNSKLFIESNCYPTSNNSWTQLASTENLKPYGYTISEYAEVINEGTIRLTSNAQARITGIIRRNTPITDPNADRFGMIVAEQQSIVSEPFRITDYIGNRSSSNAYIDRNIFPSEFYYLDSIRCRLSIKDSARYLGLITINDFVTSGGNIDLTALGYVDLVSSQKYNSAGNDRSQYGSIFKLTGSNSLFIKSYDETSNRSNFEVASGNLNYNFAYFDIHMIKGGLASSMNSNNYTFTKFTTENTGFKLSNINLIINDGATFTMPSTAYNGGNTKYAELEVLPSASIQVKPGGTLHMGQNSYIYIDNYLGDSSIIEEFKAGINKSNYYDNNKRRDAFRTELIARQDALKQVYNQSSIPMFDTTEIIDGKQYYGNVVIDATPTSHAVEVTETHAACPYTKTHAGWRHLGIKISCERDVVTSRKEYVKAISSSIYCWNNSKIDAHGNYFNTTSDYSTTTELYTYEHKCKCSTGGIPSTCPDCKAINNTVVYYSITIQRKTINDVAFAYPGHSDNYVFPLKTYKF